MLRPLHGLDLSRARARVRVGTRGVRSPASGGRLLERETHLVRAEGIAQRTNFPERNGIVVAKAAHLGVPAPYHDGHEIPVRMIDHGLAKLRLEAAHRVNVVAAAILFDMRAFEPPGIVGSLRWELEPCRLACGAHRKDV
jgi:hypothetical protein